MHIQGHRGARGLLAENTLPSFEAALDCGVNSIETDLHLTRDGIPVLCHDPFVGPHLFRPIDGSGMGEAVRVRSLTLAELRRYRADRNPDRRRFPDQRRRATPLAKWYADRHGLHPFAVPALSDLFRFAADYAGEPGRIAGKSEVQRAAAGRVGFDLELKRVPFHPETLDDGFDPTSGGLLERAAVEAVRAEGVVARAVVRSFDHRAVRTVRRLEPGVTGAVLIAGTAPVEPAELVRRADAAIYCPEFTFLDAGLVEGLHAAGVRVLPWTVNRPADWDRLIAWGVDGICTDYPDQLAGHLCRAHTGPLG